jgi:hypothetical protein
MHRRLGVRLVNGELDRLWMEAVVAYFELLSHSLAEGTRNITEDLRMWSPVQDVLPTIYTIKQLKNRPGSTKRCVEPKFHKTQSLNPSILYLIGSVETTFLHPFALKSVLICSSYLLTYSLISQNVFILMVIHLKYCIQFVPIIRHTSHKHHTLLHWSLL